MPNQSDLKDGFTETLQFAGHNLVVRSVCPAYGLSLAEKTQQFASVDERRIHLWGEHGLVTTYSFPPLSKSFILAIVYMYKLKIFFAAAADSSFKIFDQNLHLIESIRHEERTLTMLHFDEDGNQLVVAGADGVSVWRVYKNIRYSCHVAERLYRFSESQDCWITRLIVDSRAVYAIASASVHVLSARTRRQLLLLKDIHDCPVTRIAWYSRSRHYVTGCMVGLVKVWATRTIGTDDYEALSLLHTFSNLHTKSITGLAMHPIPGLFITSSMDGWVKIVNIETCTELISLKEASAVHSMQTVQFANNPHCLIALTNGRIILRKLNFFFSFIGVSTSDIHSLSIHHNIQMNARERWDIEGEFLPRDKNLNRKALITSRRELRRRQCPDVTEVPSTRAITIAVAADQDYRFLGENAEVLSVLEPSYAIASINCFAVSTYQNMLFYAYSEENNVQRIRAFDTSLSETSILCEFALPRPISEADRITSMTLSSIMPLGAFSGPQQYAEGVRVDMRGKAVPYYVEELLLIGTSSGAVHFLDTTEKFYPVFISQVHYGPVVDLVFRHEQKELFTLGIDSLVEQHEVKIWKMPDMIQLVWLPPLPLLSCWCVSASLNFIGIGFEDGFIRFYNFRPESKNCLEVLNHGETHDAHVTGISICDSLRVVASTSVDGQVKLFTTDKQHLRTIHPIRHSPTVLFLGESVLIAQRTYILGVLRRNWDSDNGLEVIRNSIDPWAINGDHDSEVINMSLLIQKNTKTNDSAETRLPERVTTNEANSDMASFNAVEYLTLSTLDTTIRAVPPSVSRRSKPLTPRLVPRARTFSVYIPKKIETLIIPRPW